LAFSKKKIEGRKEWLNSFVEGTYLDTKGGGNISISDFVNKELILFSRYDLRRSIPSMVDGLKIGQRKILFGCFKRKLKNEIKVSQLAGYVSEHSAYHHGEQSLNGTIVKMAQNYVGSNNINILFPSGQFGTRLEGGKDAASARYIFTTLCQITRSLFHTADDAVLEYLDEDGLSIEPKYYIPVIPMVLVNGAEGIGTGWSTSIPCYNPRDIIENVKNSIKGEELLDMIPWYRGFKGDIEYSKSGTYKTIGKYEKIDDNTLWITELPIGEWIQDYKVKLEKMLVAGKLEEFKEHHTDVDVSFTLIFTDEQMSKLETEGIIKELKLFSWVHFSNMTLFDSNEMIKTYATPQEIIKDFCVIRKETYVSRKKHLMKILQLDFDILDNKVRFILEVVENTLVIKKRKKSDLLKELKQKSKNLIQLNA
jgi:DNA topoisomerase II